jgi:AraC family transcriptional regulator
MDDLLVETLNGRIGPGLAGKPLATSHGKPWNGFFLKEHGPTDLDAHQVMLLKHAVWLQVEAPAQFEWNGDGRFVSKTIEPGQISICPANKLHSGRLRHEGGHIAVFLEPEFLAQAMENGVSPERIELRWELGIDSPPLRELVLLLHAEGTRPTAANGHYATAIARLIAIHLVQHHSVQMTDSAKRGGLSPSRLRQVAALVETRLGTELSLDEMAKAAGMSVFHFSRVFRQSTGMSPFQYVLKCRIERARELLLAPHARIGDVALECGFCDQAHFTRHFKRLTGSTPAAFVRSIGHRNISR